MATSSNQRWILVSDIDETLLGDDDALGKLAGELKNARARIFLIYNSSRPCNSVRRTLRDVAQLPTPLYIAGAMGTEIQEGTTGIELPGYQAGLIEGWDREQAASMMEGLGLIPHSAEYQTPFKASYHVIDVQTYNTAKSALESTGLNLKVVYSGGQNLDIIPSAAGKRAAIEYLLGVLAFGASHVIVAGDSANDLDMFAPPFSGVVVSNADRELKALTGTNVYHSPFPHAGGVRDGLRHWGVLD